ncbi:iron donor protein CyaY [Orbus hercynius]|uniref:Iron-sulfur cluster assembly protein CyaY n=1 Tax=Orbus hercynius TaxID=593135 RepID=A0A495RIM2_9GAMM|nr:iron donor protein CyaY [Orbus hercynius]RKS87124.1 iron donor protein CyaY [Orbus hercynius]
MNLNQFHQLAEQLFSNIEQQLDAFSQQYDTDIDYETHGNVISITFENHSKIIINTQEPLLQIWMASRQQGYHFDFKDGIWVCNRCGLTFQQLFNQSVQDQIAN